MSPGPVREALTALRAAHDALADCNVDTLTRTELLAVLDEVQTLGCQLPSQNHRLLMGTDQRVLSEDICSSAGG